MPWLWRHRHTEVQSVGYAYRRRSAASFRQHALCASAVQRYWHRTLYYSELCFALRLRQEVPNRYGRHSEHSAAALNRRFNLGATRRGIPCAVVQRDAYLCAAVSLPGLTTTGLSQRSLCATAIFTVPSSLRRIWRVAVRRPYITSPAQSGPVPQCVRIRRLTAER